MQIEIKEGEAALILKADSGPEVVMPRSKDKGDDEPVSASTAIAFMLAIKLCEQKFVNELFDGLEEMMAAHDALEALEKAKQSNKE